MSTKNIIFIPLVLALLASLTTGCSRTSSSFVDDTRTAGRHMQRGFRSLGGKHGDSRQIYSREEFMGEEAVPMDYAVAIPESDFMPLEDNPNGSYVEMGEMARPPRHSPGDPGSPIPSLQAFKDPSIHPQLSKTFRNIHFAYNSSLIKGEENLAIVRDVSEYMRQNPNTYAFIEGHCDERGPEAYNLALGSHRANAVRNLLISEGVSPDNLFTLSYGKERPIIVGHDEETWTQNRRAEFKIYQR